MALERIRVSPEALECLREAGRIARKARERARDMVREGLSLLDLCEVVEGIILDEGARPAFPCNVCVNDVAAHYTPPPGDLSVIAPKSLVKIDIGVTVDGYIADTAVTVSLNPLLNPLVEAVNRALAEAVRSVRPGVYASAVGGVIQRTITAGGFKPIRNLTGHEIARYNLHAGLSIPNVQTPRGGRLELGHVYALEPFATTADGSGEVVSSPVTTIYRVDAENLRGRKLSEEERGLIEVLHRKFDNLPYTPRWIERFEEIKEIHARMARSGKVYSYPVLVERSGRPVAQAEHTVIVTEEGCEVIT